MGFLRLIRFQNLLIIAGTMIGIQWAIQTEPLKFEDQLAFIFFIGSTVLIAAAGNAINDYFDLRSDRLNRPQKVVIGKRLKKRWAIIIHWGFNVIAVVISIWLGLKLNSWFFLFIHLFSSVLLWSYSVYIKKMLFWSNITIAFLVGLIPVISWGFMHTLGAPLQRLFVIGLFSAFAFLVNLSREIIKDIQDIEGDQLVHVRSIPIVWGLKRARILSSITAASVLVPMVVFLQNMDCIFNPIYFFLISLAVGLSVAVAVLSLLNLRPYVLSLLLKLCMLIGVISLFFI